MNEQQKEYLNNQKKTIVKLIIFLLIVVAVIVTYQIRSFNKQSTELEKINLEKQIKQIDISNTDISVNYSELEQNNVSSKRQFEILTNIKKLLPQTIDEITVLDKVSFNDNVLMFGVTINSDKLDDEGKQKLSTSGLNTLLLKNKPVACSLMNSFQGWQDDWKVGYEYYFSNPNQKIGYATFNKEDCN